MYQHLIYKQSNPELEEMLEEEKIKIVLGFTAKFLFSDVAFSNTFIRLLLDYISEGTV